MPEQENRELTILSDPHRTTSDIKTVGRAVREGWGVDAEIKLEVKARLLEVVRKKTVTVMTKLGPYALDGPADSNAVAAARVFVAMNGQDQADDHAAMKQNHGNDNIEELDSAIKSELDHMASGEEAGTPAQAPPEEQPERI